MSQGRKVAALLVGAVAFGALVAVIKGQGTTMEQARASGIMRLPQPHDRDGSPCLLTHHPRSSGVGSLRPGIGLGLALRRHRRALDLVLSNQPQGKDRAGEAEQHGEGQHGVEPCEESRAGGVGDDLLGLRGSRGEGLVQVARRGGLDQLARAPLAVGVPARSWATLWAPRRTRIAPHAATPTGMPT
jgi:hypothetical protein